MDKNGTPLERYQKDLQREGFKHDPAQEMAVRLLQDLYDRLVAARAAEQPAPGVWGRLKNVFVVEPRRELQKGLYFWGGVGRGKTYLMDNFFESLPFPEKMRAHFHRFMRRVHQELRTLDGQKNPLNTVADRLAQEVRVICFDEFFVSDITDAMILGTLMQALFDRGVSLVATSNIVPDGLYKDGLQRARFLPAIEMLNKHTQVVNVDGGVDYRLRALEQAELYHYPLDAEADASLLASFESLVPDKEEIRANIEVEVEGRPIAARFEAEDVAWFDFMALCDGPRSQNDYIELAKEYHAVLVANVPALARDSDDQARRFINMVDEFYDRNVKLIISAEKPLAEIYGGGKLNFEFERTTSRLLEMQSREYLAAPHRP
ncbi:cell division protein ZapE [Aestuariicella hydrocarbonica]|uniref:Cell division protein ZapE n=1 Tax=Pseudomaricurvus hydrocarbonicus TaxID=1470433 RepID=A0A9E5JY88_9GAMM|nr:cell division protein ZapE [Aestuariicella hydrocarbonica]NHO64292.1 cell division protein ZapE [Aestuariicella hydrocarbonica]